jgi:hypothetical protein
LLPDDFTLPSSGFLLLLLLPPVPWDPEPEPPCEGPELDDGPEPELVLEVFVLEGVEEGCVVEEVGGLS